MKDMYSASILNPLLPPMILGEGPFWDTGSQMLFWVDIKSRVIHRYDPLSMQHKQLAVSKQIGFAIPIDEGKFLCGLKDGLYLRHGNGDEEKIQGTSLPAHVRFNDGKCDAKGRLWCGTIPLDEKEERSTASFYRYNGEKLEEIENDIFISNGIGWSEDNRIMYHVDTRPKIIWCYDYDIETGTASNRRKFLTIEDEGSPDGLCIGPDGNLYVALYGGGKVLAINPAGVVISTTILPVPKVTSCVFGGRDQRTLFITTAKDETPLSGCVFMHEF